MSMKISVDAYKELIEGNMRWLGKQEQCCERSHIMGIVTDSVNHYYPEQQIKDLQKQLEQKDKEIGDLQRLCERALLCLSEHWDELTDDEGYGYASLESALKKAASGKEYKELRSFSDMVVRENQKLQNQLSQRIKES